MKLRVWEPGADLDAQEVSRAEEALELLERSSTVQITAHTMNGTKKLFVHDVNTGPFLAVEQLRIVSVLYDGVENLESAMYLNAGESFTFDVGGLKGMRTQCGSLSVT